MPETSKITQYQLVKNRITPFESSRVLTICRLLHIPQRTASYILQLLICSKCKLALEPDDVVLYAACIDLACKIMEIQRHSEKVLRYVGLYLKIDIETGAIPQYLRCMYKTEIDVCLAIDFDFTTFDYYDYLSSIFSLSSPGSGAKIDHKSRVKGDFKADLDYNDTITKNPSSTETTKNPQSIPSLSNTQPTSSATRTQYSWIVLNDIMQTEIPLFFDKEEIAEACKELLCIIMGSSANATKKDRSSKKECAAGNPEFQANVDFIRQEMIGRYKRK